MRIVCCMVGAVVLAACAPIQPKQFSGPNGKTAYAMECSGMGRTLEACYQKAGEVCPNGYTVIDRTTGFVAVPVSGGMMGAPTHNMAIECK